MTIQSLSFWQQDRNFWSRGRAQSRAAAANTMLINVMASAESNLSKGMSSIANATALKRVNSQLVSIVEQALQSSNQTVLSSNPSSPGQTNGNGVSTAGGTPSGGASAAGASAPSPIPATGVGKAPLTISTALSTLGILPGGTITFGTGAKTTTYTSTGTDTVADLLNAINLDLPTNANVTASLDKTGHLVITSRDKTSSIFIGGSGTDAAAIGFPIGNNTFLPKTAANAPAAAGSASSAPASSAATASTAKKAASSKPPAATMPPAMLTFSTAASLLASSGISGNLVDMLA